MNINTPIQLHNNSLPFNPAGYQNNYGILISYPQKNLTIHYEITCSFVKWTLEGKFILTLDRKQVFINNKLPDNKMYELADEMAKSIYPVTVEINTGNKIVSIINYEEILSRSKAVVEKLSEYFEGDAAADNFAMFLKHCSNPNTIIAGLSSELFYRILFPPLYIQYTAELSAEVFMPSPDMGTEPVAATVKLQPTYNEIKKVIADVHGETDGASFTIHYQLYPEDHTIYAAAGNVTFIKNEDKVSNRAFEVYHTNPEERMVNKASSFLKDQNHIRKKQSISFLVDEQEAQPKRKSFWDIFN